MWFENLHSFESITFNDRELVQVKQYSIEENEIGSLNVDLRKSLQIQRI